MEDEMLVIEVQIPLMFGRHAHRLVRCIISGYLFFCFQFFSSLKSPRDWEGVWTEEDDRRLKRVDRKIPESKDDAERTKLKNSWDFLVRKHTQTRIEQRREFLGYLGEA